MRRIRAIFSAPYLGGWLSIHPRANGENGLVIVDVSNPTAPILKGSYDTAGSSNEVAVAGNYAYVADNWNGLVIIDVSNPTAPTLKGSYGTIGWSREVALAGNYAYVADGGNGLVIVDVSNPAAPAVEGSYDTAGSSYGVAVAGNYAYVADEDNGLVILDVSNPAAPTLKGSYDTVDWSYGVAVAGNNAYVAYGSNGLVIVDVSNPTAPTLKGSYDTVGFSYGVAVAGNYAYVADDNKGLVILDVSNPTAPTLKDSYYDTVGWSMGVAVAGNYAYVAEYAYGLDIFHINTSAPTPSITVVSPNDGENWTRGMTQTISWNYTGTHGSYVKIELLKGGVLNRTINSSTSIGISGSGSYTWLINSTQTPGTDYQIRVTSTTNSAYNDTSNNNFTIGIPGIIAFVDIKDNFFNNSVIMIPVNTQVTWINFDNPTHTVTSDNGVFDSGNLQKNQSFSWTFNVLGTFKYHCSIHPSMTGIVIVISGVRGDLNNNGVPADAGDLVLMKRASIGEIPADSRYDLNNNRQFADAGDLVLMKRASIGEINF